MRVVACPKCGTEYEQTLRRCPACGWRRRRRRLATPQGDGGERAVVKLATVAGEPYAKMWAELLQRHGIPSALKGTGVWSTPFPVDLREHYLYVRAEDAERAARLLAPFAGANQPLSLERPFAARRRRHRAAKE